MEKYLNQLLQSTEQKPKAVKASVNIKRAFFVPCKFESSSVI